VIAPARRTAFAALLDVTRGRLDLDEALSRARTSLVDTRDLALMRDLVTGTLRWQSRLDAIVAPLLRTPLDTLDREVLVVLRLGTYQLEYLDRVPAAAVVDDAVSLVRAARKSSAAGLVNAVLRRIARGERPAWPAPLPGTATAELAAALAVTSAHPRWLVERWLAREPRHVVERWLAFNNTTAPLTVRANPLRGMTRDTLAARLAADGLTATVGAAPLALIVTGPGAATHHTVARGEATIQDDGSQLAALVAPVSAGQRVLDVCAAPGGKTLAYATAAGETGQVVACDVRARRVEALSATVARAGATAVRVVAIDDTAPLPFAPVFDVVAVDAPCSGLGTLRRDPDIKWRRTADDLSRYQARQRDLLERAAAVVAPGGCVVYTTCSTEPEENELVVDAFLASHPGFERLPVTAGPSAAALAPFVGADGYFRLHPAHHGHEGYFGAVLGRRPDAPSPSAVVQ